MPSSSIPSPTPSAPGRMAWIDNIRWTVIAMVVMVHASVTYSGIGSWYYKEPAALDLGSRLAFSMFLTFSQAFFMGLLFLVSAAFMPASYDRKGFARFVGERAFRLGVPALFYMLVLDPLVNLARDLGTGQFGSLAAGMSRYGRYVLSGSFLDGSGPLWFAVALLAFAVLYALARLAFGALRARAASTATLAPSPRAVHGVAAALMVLIAGGSFATRMVQPIGTSWHNMQLCFFPGYVVLFAVGLWAGRRGLLRALPREAGLLWLKLAFGVGVPAWLLLLGLGGALGGKEALLLGGMHWQAAGYAAWEAFFAVSMSIGLLTLYRERVNRRNRGTGLLADACFGIYVFHAPILVTVSMLLRSADIYPLAKAVIAAAAAFALSLGVAWLVRRIPAVGRVFA